MIRFQRRSRFLFSLLVCLMTCLASVFAVCGTATADTATTTTPAWLDQYYSDHYYFPPPWEANARQPGWQDGGLTTALMDFDYLERCQNVKAPAPEGTSLADAVKHGYTTFWEDFGNGEKIEMNVSDRQQTFAETWRLDEGEIIDAYKHDSTGKQLVQHIRAHRAEGNKLKMTSSEISNVTKKTKLPSSNVIATAKQGTSGFNAKFKQVLKKTLKPVKSGVKVTDAMVEKSYKASLGTVLKAGGARMLTLVSGAADVITAGQIGVWAGNALVGFFKIDRAEECRVMTNNIVRLGLGISDKCSKFDVSKLVQSRTDYTYSTSNCIYLNGYLNMCLAGDISVTVDKSGQAITWWKAASWPPRNPPFVSSPTLISSEKLFLSFSQDRGQTGTIQCSPGSSSYDFCDATAALGKPLKLGGDYKWNRDGEWHDDQSLTKKVRKHKTKTKVHGSDGKDYESESESEQDGNVTPPTVSLPDGVTPTTVTVTDTDADGNETTLTNGTVKDPRGDGVLDLIDVATGKSCYEESFSCATWAGDVAKVTGKPVTLESTATSTSHPTLPFKCVWKATGGTMSELPIGECTVLSNAFQDTTITAGTTGTDPDTGDHLDDPVTDPMPHEKMDYATCVKTDVSWNPVSWVFVPVKCAVQWAFEPDREQLETQTIRVQQKAHMSGLSTLPAAFKDSFGALQGSFGQHCQGPEMHITAFGHDLIPSSHPFSVCSGTGLEMLPTFSRAGFVVLSCAVCYITIRKWLSAMFGFGIGNSETGDTNK